MTKKEEDIDEKTDIEIDLIELSWGGVFKKLAKK